MRIIWVVPRQQTSARVAYAQIDTLGGDVPLEGLSEALRASLVSGTRVARYDRTWRLGPVSYSGDNAHGRIGFQSAGAVAEIWDDTQGDFVSIHPPAGQTTPYAIDMRTMRMVFQLRGQTIRPNTFRGNFQGPLRRPRTTNGLSALKESISHRGKNGSRRSTGSSNCESR